MEADISILRKTGHFYFALTRRAFSCSSGGSQEGNECDSGRIVADVAIPDTLAIVRWPLGTYNAPLMCSIATCD